MKSTTELIRESPFFETFAPKDIDVLAAHARMRSVAAGEVILRENDPAEALYMIVAGQVRLSFETPEELTAPRTSREDRILIRTLTEPGRVVGWSAVVEPYRYRDTATAIEDTHLLVFERSWLERRAEEVPEFGVKLITRILWVLGNRLREARIRLVASRYEEEALAIRALLEESASELSVTSPLHKLPIYLESRLTLSDAFQTLELLRNHGDPLEASLARMCLEILKNVRKELDVYRRLQQIYEAVSAAPEDATPEEVRRRCCMGFCRLFERVDHIIEGEENLPAETGHIFVMNHLANHPENTLPNDFQLTLDTHFVSCMVLSPKYGEPPVRVIRKSNPHEYGHQKYYDRLGYIYVYAKHVDEDERNPRLLAEQRRRAFLETAARCLRDGRNLVICPEGASTSTERSPLPFKAGAFRLAAFVDPEPLIVPVVVAHFDRKITRTTLIARVHKPFLLSDYIAKPVQDEALFAFIAEFGQKMRAWVREAAARAAAGAAPRSSVSKFCA
ncbi:MAG TPA: cyclic nucleotide-binding domain-containing protein [Candidatus Udaeobacter sp.]|nr:cyclic nucleotide-binding domain-containing protein [Candidatus Udaeobacter sp.]